MNDGQRGGAYATSQLYFIRNAGQRSGAFDLHKCIQSNAGQQSAAGPLIFNGGRLLVYFIKLAGQRGGSGAATWSILRCHSIKCRPAERGLSIFG